MVEDSQPYLFGRLYVQIRPVVDKNVQNVEYCLLATYSPHFFPDFFHIWQVTWYARGLVTLSFW